MTKTALALGHVHFEDLGSFAQPLQAAGHSIRYSSVGDPDFCSGDPMAPDLLVALGGPIGVSEEESYPSSPPSVHSTNIACRYGTALQRGIR